MRVSSQLGKHRTAHAVLIAQVAILTTCALVSLCYASLHPTPPKQSPPVPTTERIASPFVEALAAEEPPLVSSHGDWMVVVALLTAYTDHDPDAPLGRDGKPTRQTSTQTDTAANPYGIAADPKLLPYGTQVIVDEYMEVSYPDKAWEIDDTGGKMRQNNRRYFIVHLDLRYRTSGSAMKRGKEWAEIRVNVAGWTDAQKQRLQVAAANGARMRSEGMKP